MQARKCPLRDWESKSWATHCRKGDSRRFGQLVQRALVSGPSKSSEGLQCLGPDCQVNLSHFEDLLQEIDNTLRSLPATGQVWAGPEGAVIAGIALVLVLDCKALPL